MLKILKALFFPQIPKSPKKQLFIVSESDPDLLCCVQCVGPGTQWQWKAKLKSQCNGKCERRCQKVND